MSTIKLKRSSVPGNAPTTAQLELGEVAINTNDGKMYIKKDDGSEAIVEFTDIADNTTDDLTEGSTNLYYTEARANTSINTIVDKAFVDALNVDADTVDGIQASSFVRGDATDNGQVNIRVNDADFIVSDTTDSITNYIWRDHSQSKLFLGTSDAVITPRSDIIPFTDSTYDLGTTSSYFASAYIDDINISSSVTIAGTAITATPAEINLLDGITGTIWSSDNDGTGSGLDADLLDGVQGSSYLRSDTADTASGVITFSDDIIIADKIIHSGDTNTAIRFPSNDTFTVETSGLERMRVASNGNVGIGNDTTSPSYPLDVVDTASGIIARFKNGASGGTPSTTHGELVVESSGNLGIQILGTATSNQRLAFSDSDSNIAGTVEYDHTGDYMSFRTSTQERIRIDSSGNVGIGTTSPSAKLDVVGDTNSTVFEATATVDDSDQSINSIFVDINNTGNDTQTATRTVRGMLIDYDATSTASSSGYTYNQAAFGVTADISRTGDGTDTLYGVISYTTAGLSDPADDIVSIRSVTGAVIADAVSGSTIGNMYAVEGRAYQQGASAPSTAFGGIFESRLYSSATAGFDTAVGSRGQIVIDSGANTGITSAYGIESRINHNSTEVGSVITNGYLYRGDYSGSGTVTTKWGMYINDEDKNYFSGNVGIGTTSPEAQLDVTINDSTAYTSSHSGADNYTPLATDAIQIKNKNSTGAPVGIHFDINGVSGYTGQRAARIEAVGEANNYGTALTFKTRTAVTSNMTEKVRIDSVGNILIGTSTTPTDSEGNIVLNNGTAPTGSATNGVILYAEDVSSSSELKVRDEAGNVTTLSPHNFELIPEGPSEDMAWSYYSERDGKKINIDMLKAIRLLEKLSGEKLVYQS